MATNAEIDTNKNISDPGTAGWENLFILRKLKHSLVEFRGAVLTTQEKAYMNVHMWDVIRCVSYLRHHCLPDPPAFISDFLQALKKVIGKWDPDMKAEKEFGLEIEKLIAELEIIIGKYFI